MTPHLPPELEREIFEFAAASDPFNAQLRLRLLLVARRVRIWIDPLIYSHIVFSRTNNWTRLKRIIASKPPDFLARHVKSVFMPTSVVSIYEASEIVEACPDVERLACWIDHKAPFDGMPMFPQTIPLHLPMPALSRLSIELSHFLCLPSVPRLNANLTHLELVYWDKHAANYPATISLAQFTRLSHLALRPDDLRFQWTAPVVRSMIQSCAGLKVVALMDYGLMGHALMVGRELRDKRVANVVSEVAIHDWDPALKRVHAWEVQGRDGDMWERAEDIIRRNP
ncbi:hypothetical protein MKEN_00413700 [Mycena kentingensis (nom. inval.)]|nr:hypothetical protein MKEN_00413700 [Mycena kentingensis (nom. inval.)]